MEGTGWVEEGGEKSGWRWREVEREGGSGEKSGWRGRGKEREREGGVGVEEEVERDREGRVDWREEQREGEMKEGAELEIRIGFWSDILS